MKPHLVENSADKIRDLSLANPAMQAKAVKNRAARRMVTTKHVPFCSKCTQTFRVTDNDDDKSYTIVCACGSRKFARARTPSQVSAYSQNGSGPAINMAAPPPKKKHGILWYVARPVFLPVIFVFGVMGLLFYRVKNGRWPVAK